MKERNPFGRSRVLRWLLWLGLTAAAIAIVLSPILIIQPFKPQTARGVAWSYTLRNWSPVLTVLLTVGVVTLAASLWRGARWYGRTLFVVGLLPLLAITWLARQNYFEWMFAPLKSNSYARTSEANFLTPKDMVLAVKFNGEAAAYPVRWLAYHHVVADVVGGVPITATY